MNRFAVLLTALIVVLGTTLGACGGGGADAEIQSDIRTTTTGQELLDLKQALDSGALTQEEYEEQREKVLERD